MLIKLVIGPIHRKCLLTQVPQNKHRSDLKGSVQKRIILPYISIIYHSPRLLRWKHIGLYLDEKLNYNNYIIEKLSKINKSDGLLRNLSSKLARQALIIYKVFIRPHLGFGDILYDKPNNETLITLRKHNMMQH